MKGNQQHQVQPACPADFGAGRQKSERQGDQGRAHHHQRPQQQRVSQHFQQIALGDNGQRSQQFKIAVGRKTAPHDQRQRNEDQDRQQMTDRPRAKRWVRRVVSFIEKR
jgi:hypothetical protein